jgi:lysophospholipase L1-like esterase
MRPLGIRAAFVVLVVASTLLACELTLRALHLGVDLFDTSDPVLGHRYRRSLDVQVRERGRVIQYRTNVLGFRGPEPRPTKTGPRLVLLGDSFTAGQEWHEQETFPRLLESKLGAEVINLGVPAYDTGTESAALREVGRPLEPDVVVLVMYVGNDIRENSATLSAVPRPTFVVDDHGELAPKPFLPRGTEWLRSLVDASALYHWQKHEVRKVVFRVRAALQGGDPMHRVYASRPGAEWEGAWRVTHLLLARIARDSQEMGARLLLAVMPDVIQLDDALWNAMLHASPALGLMEKYLPQRRIGEMAKALGIETLDLLPVLERAGGAVDNADPLYDGHLARRGHQVVADALVNRLGSWLLFK